MRRRGIWKEIYIETERERKKGKEGEKESEREKYRERGGERERENILWGDGCASLDPSRRTRGVPGGCGWP